LVDANTGQVLAQDDAFQRWYPASLTKLMTAYLALRAMKSGQLAVDSPVKISANAAKQPPTRMGYKPGNVLTLDNAIKIMMAKSANDVAVAVAETAAGPQYAPMAFIIRDTIRPRGILRCWRRPFVCSFQNMHLTSVSKPSSMERRWSATITYY
jgi:D-alanyl-D-alanine carboxypeptidase